MDRLDHGVQARIRSAGRQQRQPLRDGLGQCLPEAPVRHGHGENAERSTEWRRLLPAGAQHLRAGLPHQLGGSPLVDGFEMRCDARLEWKPPQQSAAQRVNGHDAEPERQVEHTREQPTGGAEQLGSHRTTRQLRELSRQHLVAGRHPPAQARFDAQEHLGRGRLGEGQAQDALGVGTFEQEPQHPVGQDPGLAGAGIGRDPDRGRRVRGGELRRCRRGHGSTSVPSHSAARARWS